MSDKMPFKYWVSIKETLSSVKLGHRWPCVFEHKRDGAERYTNTEQLIEWLEGQRRQPEKGTTLITLKGEGHNAMINNTINKLKGVK